MKDLTKAEEQVMQILWKIDKGFVNDVLEKFPKPRPAYNTVSTIIRILEKKGFVSHKAYGKTHEYFPLISKKEYTSNFFKRFVHNYFGNSYQALASFMANDKNVSIDDLESMKALMEQEIQKQKKQSS